MNAHGASAGSIPGTSDFFAGTKKPAEAGFSFDLPNILSVAILARSILRDPAHILMQQ